MKYILLLLLMLPVLLMAQEDKMIDASHLNPLERVSITRPIDIWDTDTVSLPKIHTFHIYEAIPCVVHLTNGNIVNATCTFDTVCVVIDDTDTNASREFLGAVYADLFKDEHLVIPLEEITSILIYSK